MASATPRDVFGELEALLRERVIFIDGAMGTMIQRHPLEEEDFRGERYANHGHELKGNNDILVITRPDIIEAIHIAYLEGGADIIETNTFNGTWISQGDYDLQAPEEVALINRTAAELAKSAVAKFMAANPGSGPRFVAGAIGPTNKTLSVSPSVENPALRGISYDEVVSAYYDQAKALVEGGVDMFLVETIFDTLNAKAAIYALEMFFDDHGTRLPVFISGTIVDKSGRTLSGQTNEAFWNSVCHAKPMAIGLNCALGAADMKEYIANLSRCADCFVFCYPNAGLPNAMGGYDQKPREMAEEIRPFCEDGLVNAIGGCCGSGPEHIAAIKAMASEYATRKVVEVEPLMRISGLEPLNYKQDVANPRSTFLNLGERCNVAGSSLFKKAIVANDYDTAVNIALKQVQQGADILDINMDDGLIEGIPAMTRFVNLLVCDPEISKVPFMIDSSKFAIVEAGLKCSQGKCIVNSISLKEGEEVFCQHAAVVKKHGAAVVVMAFDEEGQAAGFEDKVRICSRAYNILVDKVNFNPQDIIFDPNILTIGTGLPEHNNYAVDFFRAVKEIKRVCPGSKISGGVSNIAFGFRGNDAVRRAFHSAFLHHACAAGMDMGIVNAHQVKADVYEKIDKELLGYVEDVLLNRRDDATERILDFAATLDPKSPPTIARRLNPTPVSAGPTYTPRLNPISPGFDNLAPDADLPPIPVYIPAKDPLLRSEAFEPLEALLRERVIFIDGAMGTMIQRHPLEEEDFRGERYANHGHELKGNNDILVITRPDIIEAIHIAYLEGGADIIETNTFNGTWISQGDYDLQAPEEVALINRTAAELAKSAVAKFMAANPGSGPRFVAGAIGPTNKTLSVSPSVENPALRGISYDEVVSAYYDQAKALVEGGVDMFLVETIFDTLNAKAAIYALEMFFDDYGTRLPVFISGTIVDKSGRTLSGQTNEAFWNSVCHAKPMAIGLNCALGAADMKEYIANLSRCADCFVFCYPNAGLPNAMGGYDQKPREMAEEIRPFCEDGLVNAIGGCCGSGPEHIAAIKAMASEYATRKVVEVEPRMRISGLEPLNYKLDVANPRSTFLNLGERCNVAGSILFKKAIVASDYDTAVAIALKQVQQGADVLDINMDDGLIEGIPAMTRFVNLLVCDPEISKVPFMIDSSKFAIVEAGLKCSQGKCIVNSISLKEGEEVFRKHAAVVKKHGAAVVVMAFDEQGQAAGYLDKVEICSRAYELLTRELDFPPEDIIFDPNIFAIGTGIEEHNNYAVDFINATRWIHQNLPYAKISGGVSNVSFSFRGNDTVREAIHSVFLYHAIQAGMDMGIVNAGSLAIYDNLDAELRERVEDVVLNRREDSTERLLEIADNYRKRAEVGRDAVVVETTMSLVALKVAVGAGGPEGPLSGKIIMATVKGDVHDIGKNIVGVVLQAMVIKSARVMKKAVAHLIPFIEEEKRLNGTSGEDSNAGVFVIATVKGDVHDIGKNIVGVVLGCNNFKVIDLGVMTPWDKILDAAVEHKADVIGLSGLITPSLDEMVTVAKKMEERGIKTPLLIGGATTSKMHTAVKVAPQYSGPVIHVLDASRSVPVVQAMVNKDLKQRQEYIDEIKEQYKELRAEFYASLEDRRYVTLPQAQQKSFKVDFSEPEQRPFTPKVMGSIPFLNFPIEDVIDYIDWNPFFQVWQLRGRYPNRGYPRIFLDATVGVEAKKLFEEAQAMLREFMAHKRVRLNGVVGHFPANAVGDDVEVYTDETRTEVRGKLFGLRQQAEKESKTEPYSCLSDFIAPKASGIPDYIGMFACSAGHGLEDVVAEYKAAGDDYSYIMAEALADRLAEAFAEKLHEMVRTTYWGYAPDEKMSVDDMLKVKYQGIRPAPGYPSQPDHTEKLTMWMLMDVEPATGIELTESLAMLPAASVSGLYFGGKSSNYFAVGKISKEQVQDYAMRKKMDFREVERWLSQMLNYDPV
ncbi:MAG: hypothetical protein WDW36_001936 [Sanguina aurantia]